MRFDLPKAVLGLVGLLLFVGCQPEGELLEAQEQETQEVATGPLLPAEQWLVLYLGGEQMGKGHTTSEEVEVEGRTLVLNRSVQELHMVRFGQQVRSVIVIQSLETPSGELVSFQSEMRAGGAKTTSQGFARDDELEVSRESEGTREDFSLEWSEEYHGPFALEQALFSDPLEPGETREFHALVPVINQVALYALEAADYETTELLEEEQDLLRVETQFSIPGSPPMPMTVWIDEEGRILKTHMAGIQQTTYAVSREEAEAEAGAPQFDLGEMSVAKIDRPLADPYTSQQMEYRVRLPEGDPATVFAVSESQSVAAVDEHTAEINVRALRGGEGAAGDGEAEGFTPADPPVEADLAPNSLVQSGDVAVVEMAESFAPEEEDPWQLALALERGVNGAISAKNFSQAFASAAEVAQLREGDCTEHAVLLAALCRARGLPARVAIGLVYYPQEQGYAYHMWNEVWIDGRWIPLDATLGRGGIGGAHLKLTDSNLEGATAYSAFLPVLQVIGQLEVEVVNVE